MRWGGKSALGVLILALIMTLVCDLQGARQAPEAYEGQWRSLWMSGPEAGAGEVWNPVFFMEIWDFYIWATYLSSAPTVLSGA